MMTYHAEVRINQRGITKEMIELALDYGRFVKDKVVFGKREIKKMLNKFRKSKEMKSKLLKIMDKGGIVVVIDNDIITAYKLH